MNDRELLELAAKAVGISPKPMQVNNVTEQGDNRFIGYMTDPEQWGRGWFSPLTDDGDALRLAVKLGITASPGHDTSRFSVACGDCGEILEERRPDPYSATRRAIVRCAAEIGKAMEG